MADFEHKTGRNPGLKLVVHAKGLPVQDNGASASLRGDPASLRASGLTHRVSMPFRPRASSLATSLPESAGGVEVSVGRHCSPSQRHRPSSERVERHCCPSQYYIPSSDSRPAIAFMGPWDSDIVLPSD